MKIIKLAFYKNSKTLFGRFIRFKQYYLEKLPYRSAQYSHVEIVLEDQWYSSSEVDGGVRKKKIVDRGNWDYINIEVSEDDYNLMLKECESQLGNRYNWWGIVFAQALNFKATKEGDFFCSHFVTHILQVVKKMCGVDAIFITPGGLHYQISKGK